MNNTFKWRYNLNERCAESIRVKEGYPGRVPVICERSNYTSPDCPYIDKNKYLIPIDLTVGQFIYTIKKRLDIHPNYAIFIFINNLMPLSSQTFGNLYKKHKDIDGFLYITYAYENTFGSTFTPLKI